MMSDYGDKEMERLLKAVIPWYYRRHKKSSVNRL